MIERKGKTIAFSIGSLHKGGAERVIVNLAEHYHNIGYKTYIITKTVAEDEYKISQGIVRINGDIVGDEIKKSRIRNFLARVKKLRNIWKEIAPEVIVSFIGKNNFMTILSTIGLDLAVTVAVRGEPRLEYPSKVSMVIANGLFRMADGVIFQTTDAKNTFCKAVQKKAVLLKNPLNESFVKEEVVSIRKKEIVSVGRLDDNKNQGMLINAFLVIANEYPEWNCSIYGSGSHREALQDVINKHPYGTQVSLKGSTTNIADHIQDASIFVLTSRSEGMPNVVMEAMSLGLAVISTDCPCGGPRELIKDQNGILIPVDDEERLTLELRTLMDNEALRYEIGNNAYETMKGYYPDVVLQEWQEYLEKLCAE